MKKTAVIILNWNGRQLLEQFIPAASEFTISDEAELYVADNGSTDGSLAWLREHHPEVRILELGQNYGFAEGYNRAIGMVSEPYVLLLNSDVEVTEGWLNPLVKFLDENPDVAAVQPKILSWRDRSKFEYAGAAGGYLDRLGYPYCRGRLFDCIETDHGQYDGAPADICWASGAALLVRRQDYIDAGGLDARFFAHMEEIDLCCRLHARGRRVCAVTQSAVYHVGGASLAQGNPKKTYLNFRNNLLLLHKNLPRKKGRRMLFLRRLADTLAFGMFILKGDLPQARAIVRAHSDFRRMRSLYTELPETDTLSGLPGAKRNIVADRYLLRKKR